MPERGFCGAGTCLANPAGLWHGPLLSQRGTLMLVHTSGPVGSDFTDFEAGPEVTEHYLDGGSYIEPREPSRGRRGPSTSSGAN